MANFGLNPQAGASAMARGDNVEAFVHSVQANADSEANSTSGESKEEKEGDAKKEGDN